MVKEKIDIGNIPALIWGEKSDKAYIYVHGKMSCKENAEAFAEIACREGYQTISFDLPEHGERADKEYKCDVVNGVKDLTQVGDYAFERWENLSLFACSLGAYFSLNAYRDRHFDNCLFQSPVLNMQFLIEQMFLWFHITEAELREKGEIPTPVDTLSWSYYQYVLEHPVNRWTPPTHILYAARDNLQSREIIDGFANAFNCRLTVAENSEHPFMAEEDKPIVEAWMNNNL